MRSEKNCVCCPRIILIFMIIYFELERFCHFIIFSGIWLLVRGLSCCGCIRRWFLNSLCLELIHEHLVHPYNLSVAVWVDSALFELPQMMEFCNPYMGTNYG